MAPWDDWNTVDDVDDEELQDLSYFEGKRDVILFAIDCSPSMLESYEDPEHKGAQTCHLLVALNAAVQIQKKKAIVGPNDSVGIMLFNTTRPNEAEGQGSEIKKGTYLYQPISTLSVETVQEVIQLISSAREDVSTLRDEFPPIVGDRMPMGDVFTSCNWVLRDGAPKTATKRVFLVTNVDDPHPGPLSARFKTTARTTLDDLAAAGAQIEPFFIAPFDISKFYSSILSMHVMNADTEGEDDGGLSEGLSITRIDDLLSQMRFHEAPKRSLFSLPLHLSKDFTIGVKGYGLVTEQKKGTYKYFVDLGDRMEIAQSKTAYVDEKRESEVNRDNILFGMELGATAASIEGYGSSENTQAGTSAGDGRAVRRGNRVFYTREEVRSFRTLGIVPSIKLLGFKDRSELAFEDNVQHSTFIFPDEGTYTGSRRVFAALVKSMVKKKKIGLCLGLLRRNASPSFFAMLPQEEKADEGGWHEPAGIHLIRLPYADDIRAAPVEESFRANGELKDAARAWIDKLCVKNGTYPPDAYPNPVLAFHNAQLQATAFHEEFDPEAFMDLTRPNIDMIHKRVGPLVEAWKEVLTADERASVVLAKPAAGTKRKAAEAIGASEIDDTEIRARHEEGLLGKMRVDQLKDYLRSKSQPVSGKKVDLVERVSDYLSKHT